ncbi:CRISPR/Cas system CSM-associated protein Csm3, group 7 of RAMP superfamily [Sinosporangium album]|uniref:CRISPR/Cas system CSM-associated protein Csm3, group 7 of RAMP superfamily n=1 Tax=Sinosporangium album TaxID=504805 RepID=A0A1G7VTY6_9ACTN|nr:RAMP superfamily CRISPR-associated protein [Sinosporangium album]SDG62360.1 CRISPR/Cas system CSM-associated protein Csm3, group 7 of RAMP superfamily [Sinosporangium album]
MTARAGRPVSSRLRARGWLRTESPLHVGGLEAGPDTSLPIAVDGLNRLYVPGTTLAGVLRSWARRTDAGDVADMWGSAVPNPSAEEEVGRASRVVVADALITVEPRLDSRGLPATPLDLSALEFRPSVGLDRVTGAAAQEFLYGRAVVPAGYHIRFELDIESDEDASLDEARMHALLNALSAGEVRVGAAVSRGYGSVRLLDDPFELIADRFDTPEGLLAVLRNDPARSQARRRTTADVSTRPNSLDIRIEWHPRAPVMVRSGRSGFVVDALPLTTRVDRRHLTLTLPGSSIKGALRSHAEFIERTARGNAAAAPSAPVGAPPSRHSAAFRAQLAQLPAIRSLFGSAGDASMDNQPQAGALLAEECVALVTIPNQVWSAVEDIVDTSPEETKKLPSDILDRLEDLGMAQADHVALDRWTGGSAAGRLFSVLEPHAVTWSPIRLTIDLNRLGAHKDIALALLLLILRDHDAGRIPLGTSTNRGFGDIKVTEITLTGDRWPTPTPLTQVLNTPEAAGIARAWTEYLTQELT